MYDLADLIINLFSQLDKHFLPLMAKKFKATWHNFRDDFFSTVEQHHLDLISNLDNEISNLKFQIDNLKEFKTYNPLAPQTKLDDKIKFLSDKLNDCQRERSKNSLILNKIQTSKKNIIIGTEKKGGFFNRG